MEPIYTDIHIHTSENPDNLNINYHWETLFQQIINKANGANVLLSFTDHNTINKTVYLDIINHLQNYPSISLLLGAELHINYSKTCPAYHCHILFKDNINENNIDKINTILNKLYPSKQVNKKD